MMGEVCGAVSGGVLAIGLYYGQDYSEAVGTKTEEFVLRFTELNGAVRCSDITGMDLKSGKGFLLFFARGGKKVCNGVVSSAVQVLLEQFNEWEE